VRTHSSILLILLTATPLLAKGPTSDQLKALKDAELLGTAIYAQDHAASLASDAFLAAIKADRRTEVAGWVVRSEKESQVVKFVAKRDGKYFGLYQVEVDHDRVAPVASIDPPRELDGAELGMFMARQLALSAMPHSCSTPYTTRSR
jgi:hypothetical protein